MAMPILLTYFTDPYCAWSWAFQPVFDALIAAEEDGIAITIRYVPLVPDLTTAGKSGEAIALAWERVRRMTGVPIDATAWRANHIQSSLPAILAAKAAATFGREAELNFLRALRPLLMMDIRVADDQETLTIAAKAAQIGTRALFEAMEHDFSAALAEDAREAAKHGITSTPAVVLANRHGDRVVIEGLRDFDLYERAIEVLRHDEDLAEAEHVGIRSTPLIAEARLFPRHTASDRGI